MTHTSIRNATILLLLLCFVTNTTAQTLVWEENFDAAAVSPTTWTYDFGDGCERNLCGWGNQELEYYTSRTENARIENGSLIIEARREAFGGRQFTSGRLKTEGRVHFKYGTVEARIKLPNMTRGLWPAFWTLGTIGGAWPAIGEIDVMEVGAGGALAAGLGNRQVSSATHWSNAAGDHEYTAASLNATVDLSADYHLYKMVWTNQAITMYLDNVQIYTKDISGGAAANLSEFHTPHFLLLNVAVGGQYTGIFTEGGITAPLPGQMKVDYVRLYQNPGDELYIGDNNAFSGNYGVLTNNTPVIAALNYAVDAELLYWNNLTTIPNAVPYEGANLWAVHANAGAWFGMGVQNHYKNLSNYANGALRFRFKTTYTGQFKIGMKTGHGESWINFPANSTTFGVQRNGTWSEVIIPLSNFQNPAEGRNIDLYSVKNAFMFAGDPATGAADFFFDDVYFSGGIAPNPPPMVSITAPLNNAIVVSPANIVINADATDANGTVTQVDFYNGTTLLGTDATNPYSYTMPSPAVGAYILTAKATDNQGATTTSEPITVYVSNASNNPPTANISSPTNNAAFLTPANITINATATDADGSIFKVEFYQGATLLSTSTTSPYTYTWANTPVGNYALTVKSTDNGGLSTTSSVVNISVSNPIKPTVSITSPSNNTRFVPASTISINANAADANGTVTKVDFYQGTTFIGTDNTSPYSVNWASVPLGDYVLTAKATDNDANETISAPIAVKVAPPACTGTAVSGDYSYEIYTVSGTVYFTMIPLAPITGSNACIIYINGVGYNMTASGSNFTYSRAITNGSSINIYFTYNVPSGGERNSSANPHAYVVGTVCTTGAPTVSITSPTEGATFTAPASITINATAADTDGTVTNVEFYNGTTLLGSDNTSPYSYPWTGVAVGSYVLTAKATDNSALSTTSTAVNIVVSASASDGYCGTVANGDYKYKAETLNGVVTITFHPLTPIAGCNSSLIYIRQGAAGGYAGNAMTAVGSDFIFTQTIANNTPLSIYFTYNTPPSGERNSSATPHSYTVGTNCTGVSGSAPTVNITSPANNANFLEQSTISLSATAADADGTVTKVEFFNGATLIGTATTSPYTISWATVAAGNYNVFAKATDNSGLTTISSLVRVIVNINNATGFCGTLANGDYSYKCETSGGNVVFTLHPLGAAVGSNNALIFVRETASGTYPGYQMTAVGSDFRFTKAIANGTPLSIYFTYNVPGIGDRNSSATPHSYTVGTNCLSGGTAVGITAAPVPTKLAANVISLYSNTYTNRTVNTWSAVWDNADVTDTIISSNDTKIYSNLVFAGIEFTSSVVNATAMTHFHVDIWTPNSTVFKIKLVDFGANGVYDGGDDREHELTFTPTLNGWNSFDIPLSNFTGLTTRGHLAQLILVGSNSKVYVDNIYFYNAPTANSITPAPTPTRAANTVISLYSNTYTNRTVDTWSAIWDNADVTDTLISGNDTKIYSNLNFAGIEFTANVINANTMTHFHIDAWTPNSTTFNVKLVDFGANGVYAGGDDKEHELSFTPTLNGWNSYDIPLSNFVNMTTRAHLAQLILVGSNSKVYVDNIYLYTTATIPVELTYFKAKAVNKTAVLTWQTASERNNQGFTIERSSDGTTYTTIGQVKGNGTTNTPHNYIFTDKDPSVNTNYYRLRQTDFDGKETLSPVVAVIFGKSGLIVRNTLATDAVELIVGDAAAVTVSIFNMVGQQMYSTQMQGTQQIDVSNWVSGFYIVRASTGEVQRFVKQ